jgi:hypothetical protein
MERLVSELRHYKDRINLEERFDYNFSLDECNFINSEEREQINNSNNIYYKNLTLKNILKTKLNDDFNQPEIHYWIINKWGGINNFKRNDKNDKKILDFKNYLDNNSNIPRIVFSNISSLSKIASFTDVKKFFIYDSRVIYSLNWLILKYPTANLKFFPSPFGRNKIINDFNLLPIINIAHHLNYSSQYYDFNLAYQKYCDLIIQLSSEVFLNEQPFLLEMLLFVISIKEIFEDIKENLSISINNIA